MAKLIIDGAFLDDCVKEDVDPRSRSIALDFDVLAFIPNWSAYTPDAADAQPTYWLFSQQKKILVPRTQQVEEGFVVPDSLVRVPHKIRSAHSVRCYFKNGAIVFAPVSEFDGYHKRRPEFIDACTFLYDERTAEMKGEMDELRQYGFRCILPKDLVR